MTHQVLGLDHMQIAIPVGGEPAAVEFYGGLLGLPQLPKPAALAARGGCWFQAGPMQIHLGADAEFLAAKKAHPALIVSGLDAPPYQRGEISFTIRTRSRHVGGGCRHAVATTAISIFHASWANAGTVTNVDAAL